MLLVAPDSASGLRETRMRETRHVRELLGEFWVDEEPDTQTDDVVLALEMRRV